MDHVKSGQTRGKKPHGIVANPKLSTERKGKILDTLEQDARLLDTATAEGMLGGEQSNLHQILDARNKLENEPANNPAAGSEAEIEKETQLEKLDP